ncbi:MAG: substrate-binding domain-containing protein [Nitrospinales bacterium]
MKNWTKRIGVISVCLLFNLGAIAMASETGDAKSLMIAGAGPSTKVVELLAKEFSSAQPGFSITVPPKSIKHKGGMEWVAKKGMLFGRTGRPLSAGDKNAFPTLVEFPIARVKLAFAVKKDLGVTKLSLDQLKGLYTGQIKDWKEVGGVDRPVMLLGRKKGESVLGALIKDLPYMADANFVKIYDKEHQIIKAIGDVPGAIGFSSKRNLAAKKELTLLEIKGFNSGLQVGLVYDQKNENAPSVNLFKKFIQSDKWSKALQVNDFLSL